MKKIFLILSLFATLGVQAQFVTTFAKNAPENEEDGVVYYLPRNVIRVEFTIEKTNYYIGPYAEFASKLLGANDYIKENKTEYSIKDVDIQISNEADPNAVYCIFPDEKSKEPMPNVILDAKGILMALGYDSIPTRLLAETNTFCENDIAECEEPAVTFIDILDKECVVAGEDDDDEEGGGNKKISKEDKANAAIAKIYKIRTSYFDLITGYQEVSFGEATKFMAESIKSLEDEYISLFKGKSTKTYIKRVVYVIPEKSNLNSSLSIGKMSINDGFSDTNGKGDAIKLQFESKFSLANINPMNEEALSSGQVNKLFYRIPVTTNVKVMVAGTMIAEKSLTISQFGEIKTMSVKNNKVLFNQNTGQIISINH